MSAANAWLQWSIAMKIVLNEFMNQIYDPYQDILALANCFDSVFIRIVDCIR
jgi:hypothetical protein